MRLKNEKTTSAAFTDSNLRYPVNSRVSFSVAYFLGLGLEMFTSSKPIEIKPTLIPLTFILVLMAIPITRTALASTSNMLSVFSDWYSVVAGDTKSTILYVVLGLTLICFMFALIVAGLYLLSLVTIPQPEQAKIHESK